MLAVLAAVTEIIKQNGGSESSTEYFAALMSTLEAVEDDTSVAATLSLLGMCLRTVPRTVLALQFGPTSRALFGILSRYAVAEGSENHLILRHCIGCLVVLLRAQEAAVWSNSSTMQAMDAILSFVIHAKPKIRKSAQHGVCAILKGGTGSSIGQADSNPSPPHHPAAGRVAAHCVAQLDAACESGSSNSMGVTTLLHVLTLLKDIMHQFPKSHVRTVCERLLSIMTLNNVVITSCCLQTLHGLFVTRPSEATLSFSQNGNIIKALYDYQPSANDPQPTLAWLAVLREAHCNLAHLAASSTSSKRLPFGCSAAVDVFSTLDYVMLETLDRCVGLLLSDKTEIVAGAAHTVKTILQECVAPLCEQSGGGILLVKPILRRVVETMHKTLSYRYLGAWRHVLHLTAVLFQVTSGSNHELHELTRIVKTLGDLRDFHDFAYNREAEYAIGAAIRAMGPRAVLNILPLEISNDNGNKNIFNLRRSWMIPLLKDCVTGGTIVLFKDVLLPIAMRCEERAKSTSRADGKTYECLVTQIWSILPSICNDASDVKDNFQHIARLLGIAINSRRELRLPAMAALRKLIAKATRPRRNDAAERQDDNNDAVAVVAELARFAKNYLPILFNLYTTRPSGTDEEGARLAAFDTIKAYMTIVSSELANKLFDEALNKLDEPGADDFSKESVYDLTRTLIGYTDADRLTKYYDCRCVPVLMDNTKRRDQKKAYRFLEEICGSEKDICKRFLHDHRRQIQKTLIGAASATSVIETSRGARLRCLAHLVRIHPQLEGTKFLEAIVPEAVLSVKNINEKCRDAAYRLLNAIAERFLGNPEYFKDYVDILMVGLGGEPAYVCASLLALASITYHHYHALGMETVGEILGHVCTILTSPTREIVESALSYVKVYINVTPPDVMAPTLPRIVGALSQMSEDCKRHFRQKVRDMLVKLIRKYGIGPISNMVPASDMTLHKRLKNINKIEDAKRKKRELERARKLEQDSDEEFDAKRKPKSIEEILADSDEECFEAMENESETKRKKRGTSRRLTWIQESEDNIVDFADPTAARNITTTQPVSNPKILEKKVKDPDFATAPDGRLIIMDNNEKDRDADERNKKRKKKTSFLQSDSEDDYRNEDDVSVMSTKITGKKRKYSESTLDATSLKSQSSSRYRAGGSGIHRSLKMRKVESEPGSEYRATKARGDIKRKGKPDPYAYVPLTRSILNKRKKKKNIGKFQSIVTGARKGARTGIRNKRRKC
ncbi:RRP12-like protein isoform X2 [Monomorium pharaonis]|nr:RRP12-like protein isoform X2 [Monomorium pharaonis]